LDPLLPKRPRPLQPPLRAPRKHLRRHSLSRAVAQRGHMCDPNSSCLKRAPTSAPPPQEISPGSTMAAIDPAPSGSVLAPSRSGTRPARPPAHAAKGPGRANRAQNPALKAARRSGQIGQVAFCRPLDCASQRLRLPRRPRGTCQRVRSAERSVSGRTAFDAEPTPGASSFGQPLQFWLRAPL